MRSRIAGALAAAWMMSALPLPAAAAPIDAHVLCVSLTTATAVPEPEVVALVAIAVVAVLVRQIRKLRRVRTARLH